MAAAYPCSGHRRWQALRWCLLCGLAPLLLSASMNCDWHSGEGVNYTQSPWTFSVDKDCTTLELPVRLWGPMEVEGAAALAQALQGAASLKRLDLDYNHIGDEGAAAVASALQHLGGLAAVDLKGNSIGDKGAKAISIELWHTPQLTHLDLERNKIGASGTRAVAAALRKTPMLMFLSMASNTMGDEGAKALASVLRHMPSLTGLDVASNGIGEEGEVALAAAMARIEAGRGGEQFQYVTGISHELLEKARISHPTPPADVLEAKHRDLQALPIWQFFNKQCHMNDSLDGIVAMLATLGIQELQDLHLWSDIEIERNLKRSGIPEGLRAIIVKCVNEEVRGKIPEPPLVHTEDGSEL